jgi:hypothetical protein
MLMIRQEGGATGGQHAPLSQETTAAGALEGAEKARSFSVVAGKGILQVPPRSLFSGCGKHLSPSADFFRSKIQSDGRWAACRIVALPQPKGVGTPGALDQLYPRSYNISAEVKSDLLVNEPAESFAREISSGRMHVRDHAQCSVRFSTTAQDPWV